MYVARIAVPHASATVEPDPTHIVFVLDCSGSMGWTLRDIAKSLKNKLPQLVNVGDLVSIVWFSGKGQYGILQEAVEVRALTDFARLNQAIDKYLQPVGLTGFKQPLEAVVELVQRTNAAYPGFKTPYATSLFFHTDGMDNQWATSEILAAVEKVAAVVDSAAVVEYGWYCNRSLLTQMAEKLNGANLFAQEFEALDEMMSTHMARRATSKRIEVTVGPTVRPYAYTVGKDGTVTVYPIKDGTVSVPEGTEAVYTFREKESLLLAADDTGKYAALNVLAQRMDSDGVYQILQSLGDVFYINQFGTCFSKQDYVNFQANVQVAITEPRYRLLSGYDPTAVPDANAYTILDMLSLLAGDEACKFHPYHPGFKYERMSRKREQAGSKITDAERQQIIDAISAAKDTQELDAAKGLIEQVSAGKFTLKATPVDEDAGYPINLTYSEDRPNINMLVRIPVTVDLSGFGELATYEAVPATFETFIYRNYNVIRDGIRHTSMMGLPFELSQAAFAELQQHGVISSTLTWEADKVYVINADLPVVNRSMVKSVSAKTFFTQAVELLRMKAKQKVLDYFFKAKFERVSLGFQHLYGEGATEWLKSLGITEYSGFSPAMVQAEATDEYTAKRFVVKIAKCSSLPKVEDVRAKIQAGKALTVSEALLAPAIQEHDVFLASHVYLRAANQEALYKTWIESETAAVKAETQRLIKEMAKTKFAIMVGHVWFQEFASLDENSMDIACDGYTYSCSAVLEDVTVKI